MANVRISWTLPLPNASFDDIDHIRVERESGSDRLVEADAVDPTDLEVTLGDQPTGAQVYHVISVAPDGDENSVAEGVVVVEILPQQVENVLAESV